MGRRGPKPTPTATLKRRGSWRAKAREAVKSYANPSRPKKPVWVKGKAKTKWYELIGELEAAGTLATTDREALARYCDTWAWWRDCREFIEKHGDMYAVTILGNVAASGETTPLANFKHYPKAMLATKLATQLARLEQSFGLTPAARADVTPAEKPKDHESKLDLFIRKSS